MGKYLSLLSSDNSFKIINIKCNLKLKCVISVQPASELQKMMTLFKQVFFFRRPLLLCKRTDSHAPKQMQLLLCVAGQDSQTNRENVLVFFTLFTNGLLKVVSAY